MDEVVQEVFEYKEWYDRGRDKERENIIRLLEENRVPCNCGDACEQWDAGYEEAIAIVKGDTGNIPERFRDISNGE